MSARTPRGHPHLPRSGSSGSAAVEVSDLVDALGELPAVGGCAGSGCGTRSGSGVSCRRESGRTLRHMHGRPRYRPHGSCPGARFARSSPRDPAHSIPARISSRLSNSTLMWGIRHAVLCEQRREAVVVAHHRRVGELAAQRLDLDAIRDGLKVAHRVPPRHIEQVPAGWTWCSPSLLPVLRTAPKRALRILAACARTRLRTSTTRRVSTGAVAAAPTASRVPAGVSPDAAPGQPVKDWGPKRPHATRTASASRAIGDAITLAS